MHTSTYSCIRIYLILEWCCVAPLAVVPGRLAPLGAEIDAVIVRVPSHRGIRIYLMLEWCCVAPLAVVPGRAAPL